MKNTLMATHLRLVGMAALWGASWSWGKVVAQSMAPLAAASLRFLFASVVLLLWMHRASALRDLRKLSGRQWFGLTAAAMAGVFGYSSFFMLRLPGGGTFEAETGQEQHQRADHGGDRGGGQRVHAL